ncbi:MAG: MBL fold metallo-hydrolase [Clostridiales bacterium]|nr:MBL fold metallo-hydrolase [Clostridiales bacterium]
MEERVVERLDLGGVNAWLVKGTAGWVLFDTGGHLVMDRDFDGRRDILRGELEQAGCRPDDLRLIVLTHGDVDHGGNAAWLRETYGAPVALHPGDRPLVEQPGVEEMMESFHYRSPLMRLFFRLMKRTIQRVMEKTRADFTPFTPDVALLEGMSLAEYGLEGELIYLPGHTPGSVGYRLSDGTLIAGDTLVNNGHPSPAPNAWDFERLDDSIRRLSSKDIRRVCPGHGAPFDWREYRRK